MRIKILASGSKGNCTYFETPYCKIIIDLGISFLALKLRLKEIGVRIEDIDALLITHEHGDHANGLRIFCKRSNARVYLSQGTLDGLSAEYRNIVLASNHEIIAGNQILWISDMEIRVIEIHHDANEPLGFVLQNGINKVVYITDTGYIDVKLHDLLQNADVYIIESNHDTEVLWASDRAFMLKKRIAGDYGHLSNEDSAVCIAHVIGPKTKHVFFAHISEECNAIDLIYATYYAVLNSYGVDYEMVRFHATSQYEPSEEILL